VVESLEQVALADQVRLHAVALLFRQLPYLLIPLFLLRLDYALLQRLARLFLLVGFVQRFGRLRNLDCFSKNLLWE
jgi:hypothetical protein